MPTGTQTKLSKEFLEEHYLKQLKSCTQIGNELGVSKKPVIDALHKFNIPIRKTTGCHTTDLVGRKFFSLIVISKAYKDEKNRVFWNCECDCGGANNKLVVLGGSLRSGHTKSCGCRTKTALYRRFKYVGDLSGSKWNSIKRCAEEKGRIFQITQQDAWDQFVKQDGKCALSGIELSLPKTDLRETPEKFNASLDRIDSTKGYEIGNIQWVTKRINTGKMHYSQDEFIQMCHDVSYFQNSKHYQG